MKDLRYHYFFAGIVWSPFVRGIYSVVMEDYRDGTIDYVTVAILLFLFGLATYGGHRAIERIWG